jgi:hypothetical protein
VSDEELAELYEERGVPTNWVDITPGEMGPAYRLYWKAFKSPSANLDGTDEYWRAIRDPHGDPNGLPDEAEELIHDPVNALRKGGLLTEDDTPHISTMVVNHERTLKRSIVYAMVLVSTNPNTVGITLAKEEYKESEPNKAEAQSNKEENKEEASRPAT